MAYLILHPVKSELYVYRQNNRITLLTLLLPKNKYFPHNTKNPRKLVN